MGLTLKKFHWSNLSAIRGDYVYNPQFAANLEKGHYISELVIGHRFRTGWHKFDSINRD